MARLCLACHMTQANSERVCRTCGRRLEETERAWRRGHQAWLHYLDVTGWYPGRRDEWAELRLQPPPELVPMRPAPPVRLVARYMGGHPGLARIGRVVLTREEDAVLVDPGPSWLARRGAVRVVLADIVAVRTDRTVDTTLDEAVLTAAIGGARTGPLGVALGAAIGRRQRVIRSVYVTLRLEADRHDLVFRPLVVSDQAGANALARIFQMPHYTQRRRS